jgi:long-chain fatty acid transport protein
MKRVICWLTAALLFLFLLSPESYAAGFRLPDQSASAMGMAGAFVGQADDATAVWYNPAGITQLSGTQVAGGLIAIYPVLTHETTNDTTDVAERKVHVPVHLYFAHKVNDKIALGLGVNNPFGLSTGWSDTSATRYVSTFSKIVTTEINPNVAFQANPSLSVGIGIAYVNMRATMEKLVRVVIPPPPALVDLGDHNFRLSGDGDGWGANIAVLYKVSEPLKIGFSYRSRIKVDLDGTADLTGEPAAQSGTGSTSITLPDLIGLGISYKVTDRLNLNADLDYTRWSTYDRLVIVSDNATFNSTIEKQWKDVWCLRFGAQYTLSEQWKVRGGLVYDQNPVPDSHFDTSVPDSDRIGITAGLGYSIDRITVDAAYMYLKFLGRTITNSLADDDANPFTPPDPLNGTYRSQAHLVAVTVGYKF